jgi:hypothetical protein
MNLEGVGEKQTEGDCLFHVAVDSSQGPTHHVHHVPGTRSTQAKREKKAEKMCIKQMSDLTQIFQQQRLENKKLEKLFSDSKRKSCTIPGR